MKFSTGWKLTPKQRALDRKRAEHALGRPTREPECVHHHSPTQLVICPDSQYHALLHQRHHAYRLEHDPEFAEILIAKVEARGEIARRECDAIRRLFLRMGFTNEEIDCELLEWPPIQAS